MTIPTTPAMVSPSPPPSPLLQWSVLPLPTPHSCNGQSFPSSLPTPAMVSPSPPHSPLLQWSVLPLLPPHSVMSLFWFSSYFFPLSSFPSLPPPPPSHRSRLPLRLVSTLWFIGYSAFNRNKPKVYPKVIIPGLLSGIMWGIAMSEIIWQ